MTPTPRGSVVVRRYRPAARKLVTLRSPSNLHHHHFGGEGHPLVRYSLDGDDPIRCNSDAHVVPLGFSCLIATETMRTACASFDEGQALRAAAVNPDRDGPLDDVTPRSERQGTHGNPRSPSIVTRKVAVALTPAQFLALISFPSQTTGSVHQPSRGSYALISETLRPRHPSAPCDHSPDSNESVAPHLKKWHQHRELPPGED
jgi:hypothetical protein